METNILDPRPAAARLIGLRTLVDLMPQSELLLNCRENDAISSGCCTSVWVVFFFCRTCQDIHVPVLRFA